MYSNGNGVGVSKFQEKMYEGTRSTINISVQTEPTDHSKDIQSRLSHLSSLMWLAYSGCISDQPLIVASKFYVFSSYSCQFSCVIIVISGLT